MKLTKNNLDLMKKVFEIKPCVVLRAKYSQASTKEFFKFYDENINVGDHKVLDVEDYGRFISTRSSRREPAITRVITSLAYKVDKKMISLAEGMPNEGVFPFKKLSMDMKKGGGIMMEGKELAAALQYVPSQGLPSLLTELRKFQEDIHRPPDVPRDLMITNGGQHGIYQCAELLLEPGDPIVTTEYAYTGLHSTLKPYQPEILGVPEDNDGLIPETLECILEDRLSRGLKMPKMMYVIPTGSNPTGTVISVERRMKIYALACKYDFIIVEDDPYMFLNYSGRPIASFLSMDKAGRVIRLDSVSKVVSAGLRGGWVTAPSPLLERLQLHSQAELLHPCTLSQAILLKLVQCRETLGSYLKSARDLYWSRRDALHLALQPLEGLADWAVPDAGLFFWLRVRDVDDVYSMIHTAFERGLMLVPGQAFIYDSNASCQYIRLTFSKIRLEDMSTASQILSEVIRDEQKKCLEKEPKRYATES